MNPLISLQNFFCRVLDIVLLRPKTSLLLFLIPFTFLGVMFRPLEVHITIDKLINKNFQSSKEYFQLQKEFQLGKTATIIFHTDHPFTQFDLCQMRKKSQELLFRVDGFSNYFSLLYLRETFIDESVDPPIINFPYALHFDCESKFPVNFTPLYHSPWKRILLSSDHSSIFHQLDLQKTNDVNFENDVVPNKFKPMAEIFNSLANVTTYYLGDIPYQYYFKEGLNYNNFLNLFIILFIGIIFHYFYGTYLSTIFFITSVIISMALLFFLMSLFHVPIDILNNSLILLITVSSLGDFVFLSSFELTNSEDWIKAFKKIITPSFFTSLTTFIGFISLCTSDIEVVRRLGLWGGLGGMIEWFVVMFIIPLLMKILLNKKSWVIKRPTTNFNFLESFFNKVLSRKIGFLWVSIVLTIPFTIGHLNVNDDPSKLFPANNNFSKSINFLSSHFHFKGDVSLVFKDKMKKDENIKKLELMKTNKLVSHIENPYENLDYFLLRSPEKYKELISDGLQKTIQFKRFFSKDKLRAIIYLKKTDMKEIEELRKYTEAQICQDHSCYLSGPLIAYGDFSQKVPQTLIESFRTSIVLIFITILFLSYFSRNIKNIFSLSLSAIWGVALLLLIIYLFQIEINFITSVVISILVGMTGDNTIHYILAGLDSDLASGLNQRASASIINTLTMVCCSVIFLFYAFIPPQIFGILLILGLIITLIGDYWVLKALLKND